MVVGMDQLIILCLILSGKKIIPNKIKSLSSGIEYSKNILLIPYNDIKLTKKILDKYIEKNFSDSN